MLRFHLMGFLCLCFEKHKKQLSNLCFSNMDNDCIYIFTIIIRYWHTEQERTGGWKRHWIPQGMVYLWILAMTLTGVFPEQWVPATQKAHYTSLFLHPNNACLSYLQVMCSYHRDNILHWYLHSHHTENTMSGSTSYPSNGTLGITKQCAHAAQKMCHVFSLNNEFSLHRRHINSVLICFSTKYRVSTAHKTHSVWIFSKSQNLHITHMEESPKETTILKVFKKWIWQDTFYTAVNVSM